MSKNQKKIVEIVNLDGENLYIFWRTSGILRKFPGKIWLMIILKVIKNHGLTFSLENPFLDKNRIGENKGEGVQIDTKVF